jgi:flagellar basal body rod protein FlgG
MSGAEAIAASGMRAATQRLNSSAHNLASLETRNFRREQVLSAAQADGTVSTTTVKAQQEGSSIEHDLIAQLEARNAFLASLAVFRTAGRLGRVVDLYA